MNKKRIIISIIVILALIIAVRIILRIKNAKKNKNMSPNKVTVLGKKVKPRDVVERIMATGEIVGQDSANVFSQVPGKVKYIFCKSGDYVYAGRILFKIDRDIIGMTYELAPVTAPISGYVGTVNVDRGQSISSTTALTQVVNMRTVEAVINLAEKDINRVKIGAKALIKVQAFPNQVFEGAIVKKSAIIDSRSRTQEVRIKINNQGTKLRHGMFATVAIIINVARKVIALPSSLIVQDKQGKANIFIYQNGKAVLTPITTGIRDGEIVEIKTGIKAGDTVITLGFQNLSNREDVAIEYEKDNTKKTKSQDNEKLP